MIGSSPFCTRNTRSGLSAKTSMVTDQVQPSCPGRLSSIGFGQFGTTSYGPKMSCPPLCPGTAANPSPGSVCSWVCPVGLTAREIKRRPPQAAVIVATRLFILFSSVSMVRWKAGQGRIERLHIGPANDIRQTISKNALVKYPRGRLPWEVCAAPLRSSGRHPRQAADSDFSPGLLTHETACSLRVAVVAYHLLVGHVHQFPLMRHWL